MITSFKFIGFIFLKDSLIVSSKFMPNTIIIYLILKKLLIAINNFKLIYYIYLNKLIPNQKFYIYFEEQLNIFNQLLSGNLL